MTSVYHHKLQLSCVVHGDEFVILAEEEHLDWLQAQMAEKFEITYL